MSELVVAGVQQWDIDDDNSDDLATDRVLHNENENRDQLPDPRGLIKRQGLELFCFNINYAAI